MLVLGMTLWANGQDTHYWCVTCVGIVEGIVDWWTDLAIWQCVNVRCGDMVQFLCFFCQSEGLWVVWYQSPLRRHQIKPIAEMARFLSSLADQRHSAKSSLRQTLKITLCKLRPLKQKAFRSLITQVKIFETKIFRSCVVQVKKFETKGI